jgi:uncharacterized SAM-binding protein YcdF (DUF218 family)
MQLSNSRLPLVQTLWDYHHLNHKLQAADCIIVMGCQDLGVAHKAIELYQQNHSELLLFSGGLGKITKGLWHKSEAEVFADVAMQAGIAKNTILLETQSSNCGENILFAMQLLAKQGLKPSKIILVTKPYLERRAFATFKQHFADIEVYVASQQISLVDYLGAATDIEQVIHLMVGDLQRLMLYPAKGFQIPQVIPEDALQAYKQLVLLGYNQYLNTLS